MYLCVVLAACRQVCAFLCVGPAPPGEAGAASQRDPAAGHQHQARGQQWYGWAMQPSGVRKRPEQRASSTICAPSCKQLGLLPVRLGLQESCVSYYMPQHQLLLNSLF
eukprot:1157834-Pelagomonas_calceolata.AAC.16